MKLRTRVVMQLATLCFVLAAYGFAADEAYLYIVHGIPGRDTGSTLSPAFPIDVLINGETCIPRNLAYGTVSGPYSLLPGTYDVVISDANTLAPCTNPPIVTSQVTLAGGTSVSAVAEVSGGQPALVQFTDTLTPLGAGNARFAFAQTADAGTLETTLLQLNVTKPKTFTVTASAGKQEAITVPAGTYLVQLYASGSTTVLASETIILSNQSATFAYAAGESSNGSLGLFSKTVLGVF